MSDRYISRHKKLTPYEREILTILQEECAEIIVYTSKAIRFGLDDGYPGRLETNREAIGRELGDLDAVIELAKQNGLFSILSRHSAFAEKLEKLARYMQHKPEDR